MRRSLHSSIQMRTGKELILATKVYTQEDRLRSWAETLITLFLMITSVAVTLFAPLRIWGQLPMSVITALLYVRMFVIYHDYQHHAILQKSPLASSIMVFFGIYILAPQNIWKRSHDHHHTHNSKLTITGIGSYPTISKERFLTLTEKQKTIYLINRHPLTVFLGYITLFIYWLNIKSFIQSPKKHFDSLAALLMHLVLGAGIIYYCGTTTFWIAWVLPFFIAFAIGSYLFYCQHNFPDAVFKENPEWSYAEAALSSTSFMVLNPVMNWFTGDIGYHHVHHMNSRIPFYRLKEAMRGIPELQNAKTTSLSPKDIFNCLMLKVWDGQTGKMLTKREIYQ